MGAAQTPDVVVILGLLVIVAVLAAVVRYVCIPCIPTRDALVRLVDRDGRISARP